MALENVLVYNFASGDNTYPHSGTFTIGVAGKVTIDDSDGTDDAIFGDFTHTGGADVPDQDVSASTVPGINVGDTIDLRYKYTITGSDGSSGTIYFVATNSAANYGPLFVSDFPLTSGVTYTFGTFNTDGAVPYSSLVPCFTSGTSIATISGERLIDELVEGDLVLTRDSGFQPIRWIGRCTVPAIGSKAPIHIAEGALQNNRDLLVSPNHRMLLVDAKANLHFGEQEVLVAAKHLTNTKGISRRPGGMVTYVHILFDQHQIVVANSAYSESFFPGPSALNALEKEVRQEVLGLFPELSSQSDTKFQQTARLCLKAREAIFLQRVAA
ncbi:Hint domain-containing protein [Aliiroseovarius marinus]|uniref:Hint domain-containing protein n=1 Tax=Aliiroseovarius marinus TaxID=2500159 RepID=UPI003D7EFBA5